MNILSQILFIAMSLCLATSAATGQEDLDSSIPNNQDGEILDVQTDAELRSYLNEIGQILPPSDCSYWNEDETRVAAVFDYHGHEQLWIGSAYSDVDGIGVDGLQRMYKIKNFSKGGSPLRGSIQIRLPTPEMDVERACFSNLKGVQIRGTDDNAQGVYQDNTWKMTVRDIKFDILFNRQGLWGEKIQTGETQVTLEMSERWAVMAWRKSIGHLWALPGSLLLMVLWTVGARIFPRIRTGLLSGVRPRTPRLPDRLANLYDVLFGEKQKPGN